MENKLKLELLKLVLYLPIFTHHHRYAGPGRFLWPGHFRTSVGSVLIMTVIWIYCDDLF